MNPLSGIFGTHIVTLCYRAASPHGDGWWFTAIKTHSLAHSLTIPCPLPPVRWTFTFSAKEKDTETGLSYFGSRYYSSDLSIWLSVDPMSDKYPSLSPYVYCADNPVKLIDFDGQDWVLVTGNAALWYGGEVGDKSNLIHTYKATSGLNNATTTTGAIIDCQYAKYQNVRNGGPTPEGQYYINLKPDPNRIANADPKTGQLLRSPEGGIEKIPDYYQREDGHYCTYSEWGKHRAKLEPVSVTGASNRDNNSFYIHDSEKGFTHGCIEIEKEFFNDLMEYGDDNSKIDVIIEYPGPDHNTNGGTKKTVITE
ncbi:MAG: L,D-transpeptidase family protein [Bacteroidales bacterium]|nr:L,D-transpeptidase family protein [Bacteroidales bacterium]